VEWTSGKPEVYLNKKQVVGQIKGEVVSGMDEAKTGSPPLERVWRYEGMSATLGSAGGTIHNPYPPRHAARARYRKHGWDEQKGVTSQPRARGPFGYACLQTVSQATVGRGGASPKLSAKGIATLFLGLCTTCSPFRRIVLPPKTRSALLGGGNHFASTFGSQAVGALVCKIRTAFLLHRFAPESNSAFAFRTSGSQTKGGPMEPPSRPCGAGGRF